jgi:hypothetical protein
MHASWLDMAELWFISVLTRGLLLRDEFTSRADLTEKISDFTIRHNRVAQPFTWACDARVGHARHQARHAPAATGTRPSPPEQPHPRSHEPLKS